LPRIHADWNGFENEGKLQREAVILHEDISKKIIGSFYDTYNELGHGFLESVYGGALAVALTEAGIPFVREQKIQVCYQGRVVGDFKADFIVAGAVLVELKAVAALDKVHEAQILNYLRATNIEVGLLMNYGTKPEFKRFMYENSRKALPVAG